MAVEIDKNKIWVKSILLSTILSEDNIAALDIPEILQVSIINNVCRYVETHICIPDEMEEELFLYCQFMDDPTKGQDSPTIAKIFSEFLLRNIPTISSMMSVSPSSLN